MAPLFQTRKGWGLPRLRVKATQLILLLAVGAVLLRVGVRPNSSVAMVAGDGAAADSIIEVGPVQAGCVVG